jgi:hypothetical protein
MIFIGFLMFQNIYSQKPSSQLKFNAPLDIPMYLSGNFGELRPGHFHSGLDIKTQGVTGKKVYSVDDGYVSRIKIQINGYGNSIYITHPGGFTSVYGHLESFSDTITRYIRSWQYQKKSQTIDIYPDKELFKIKKGDIIAFSGNTGSSGGPHLHFELRGTSSQHPLNGLLYGFEIKDNLPPQVLNLYVYPIGETPDGQYPEPKTFTAKKNNGIYHLSDSDTITLKGRIGFGIETYDLLNEISNQCGIYAIELSIDEQVIYLYKIDEFSFSESSFIDAHADYRAMIEKNKKVHLLYHKPNNQLGLYPILINNGFINFIPGEISTVSIKVSDAYGNKSELIFYVKGSAPAVMSQKKDSVSNTIFKWNTPNYYANSQLSLSLSPNILYEDCIFNYSRTDVGFQSIYPYTHYIGDRFVPLNKPADLSFLGDQIPEQFRKNVLVAMIEDSNKISCLNSSWNGNRISAHISKFGKFTLVIDTIPPKVIPINFVPGSNLKSQSSIVLKVTDDLSGIGEYQGFIDDSWALFEYDQKNDILLYTFDNERIKSNAEHNLILNIRDLAGNLKMYQAKFIY